MTKLYDSSMLMVMLMMISIAIVNSKTNKKSFNIYNHYITQTLIEI
jgi:hypothetical protein